MTKTKMIRGSLIYLITLLVTILFLFIPIGGEFVAPFIGLFYYIKLKRAGRIKPFDWKEIALILAYTLTTIIFLVYLNIVTLEKIPWWQLILIGIAADVYASTIGAIPTWGDFTAAILAFIMAGIVAGGITGIILGFGMGLISILPGPSMGANTFYLIIFKLLSMLIAGGN